MIVLILSIVAVSLQVLLVVKWSSVFLMNKRRRKLFQETGDFHTKYYEEMIHKIVEEDPIEGYEKAGEILSKYSELSDLYFSGCSLSELKDACMKFKVEYARYIPEVKKNLRNKNIDFLLEE